MSTCITDTWSLAGINPGKDFHVSPFRPLRAVGQRGRALHSTLFPACATNVQPSLAGLCSWESRRVREEGAATTPNIAVTEGREGGRAQRQPRNAPAQEESQTSPSSGPGGPRKYPTLHVLACAVNSVKDHPHCLRHR